MLILILIVLVIIIIWAGGINGPESRGPESRGPESRHPFYGASGRVDPGDRWIGGQFRFATGEDGCGGGDESMGGKEAQ